MKKLVKSLVLALVLAAPVAISAPEVQAQTPTTTKPATNYRSVKSNKHHHGKKHVRKTGQKHANRKVNRTVVTGS